MRSIDHCTCRSRPSGLWLMLPTTRLDFGAKHSRPPIAGHYASPMAPPTSSLGNSAGLAQAPYGVDGPEIGVVHYGLGPIGRSVAALIARRPWLRSTAAVDVDPELQGRRLSDMLATFCEDSPFVRSRVGTCDGAIVAVHCTGSSLSAVLPQLEELIELKLNVVSTTEELSYPWITQPALAEQIDALAKKHSVSVLGTGVNPGFAMEYLPIAISGASQEVHRVLVHRTQDAGARRIPLQRKVGAGLSASEFRTRVERNHIGHVGLRESVHALAHAFGWSLSAVDETIEPVVAASAIEMPDSVIPAGHVTGIHQRAVGLEDGVTRVELILDMAVGIGPSADHIKLDGTPGLEVDVPGGFHGDTATAAMVANTIPLVIEAEPGLRVMSELPPPRPFFG